MATSFSKSINYICESKLTSLIQGVADWELMSQSDTLEFYTNQPPMGKQRAFGKLEWEDIPEPPIEDVRTAKLAEMRTACGDAIDAGFDSNALGYDCHYRNTDHDQTKMRNAAMLDGGVIWRNEKATLHTKVQAEIVFAESAGELNKHTLTYDNKCIYITDESRTVEEIEAVIW